MTSHRMYDRCNSAKNEIMTVLQGMHVWHSGSKQGARCCLYRLDKFKQNGCRLYYSCQMFSYRDRKKVLEVAGRRFFSVTN